MSVKNTATVRHLLEDCDPQGFPFLERLYELIATRVSEKERLRNLEGAPRHVSDS